MKTLTTLALLLALSITHAAEERAPDLVGLSDRGMTIEIYSELSPIRINEMHNWRMRVIDRDGEIQELELLSVFGGMPEHDHGMPTQPEVTTFLGDGYYLLEGVRFHMQGMWRLQVELEIYGVGDTAIIEFDLQ